MPTYTFQDDSGRTVDLESDQQPDIDSVNRIFQQIGQRSSAVVPALSSALIPKKTSALAPSTALGSFAGGAARNALPTSAFLAAAPTGAEAGAAAGAFVPVLGETGLSELIGGGIGGLISGSLAAWGAHKLQTGVADTLAPKSVFGSEMEQQQETEHPIASEAGALLTFGKPNPMAVVRAAQTLSSQAGRDALSVLAKQGYKALAEQSPEMLPQVKNVVNVASGAGLNAALNAYDQIKSGNYSANDLAKAAAQGALFNQPWIRVPHISLFGTQSVAQPDLTDNAKSGVISDVARKSSEPSDQQYFDFVRATGSAALDRVTAAVSSRQPVSGTDARLSGSDSRMPSLGYAYDETGDVFHPVRITQPTEVSNASQVPSPAGVPELEVRPPVGETPPLRQPGETTEVQPVVPPQQPAPQPPVPVNVVEPTVPLTYVTPEGREYTSDIPQSQVETAARQATEAGGTIKPPEIAPVTFNTVTPIPGTAKFIGWYKVAEPFVAPDLSAYLPGKDVSDAQLQRWGMKIPDAEQAKAAAVQEPEKIAGTAIKLSDGTIFRGSTPNLIHAAIINQFEDSEENVSDRSVADDNGFVTTKGRYVGREEAAKIAQAGIKSLGAEHLTKTGKLSSKNIALQKEFDAEDAAKQAQIASEPSPPPSVTNKPLAPPAVAPPAGGIPASSAFPIGSLTIEPPPLAELEDLRGADRAGRQVEKLIMVSKMPEPHWSQADEKDFVMLKNYRARQRIGDDAPAWGRWSEFRVQLDNGHEVAVITHPTSYAIGNAHSAEMYGPITGTGYRSFAHFEPPSDMTPQQWAKAQAEILVKEFEKEQLKAQRAAKRAGKASALVPKTVSALSSSTTDPTIVGAAKAINQRTWWHVPPQDISSLTSRGKFYSSSQKESDMYAFHGGEAVKEKVLITNPLVGDEDHIESTLFGSTQVRPSEDDADFYAKRTALDERLARAAVARGYDAIALTTPEGYQNYLQTGKLPASVELNTLRSIKPPTQTERVTSALAGGQRKTADQLAKELDIINHNVRRILGEGAKAGKFERIAKGVYALKNKNGSFIYIESTDSVVALPELARRGVKADFVFLDPPYKTVAITGGNRGIKNYQFITPEQFSTILAAAKTMLRTPDSPIYYMFSQAPSGLREMQRYTDAFEQNGFKLVARGGWQKTFKSGEAVTNVRGKVAEPEGIALFTQSGKLAETGQPKLEFKMERPPFAGEGGRQSQKPAELYSSLLGFHTENIPTEERANFITVDPFAGTGGLAEASGRQGVSNISYEIDEDAVKKFIVPKVEAAVTSKKSVEQPAAKLPWQMTRSEYAATDPNAPKTARMVHEREVRQAVSKGKPVPPEVLADYPELKPPEPGEGGAPVPKTVEPTAPTGGKVRHAIELQPSEGTTESEMKDQPLSEQQVVDAITPILPSLTHVKIHTLPDEDWAGRSTTFTRNIGVIDINSAQIESPEMARYVLKHELIHAVWGSPDIKPATDTILKLVTDEMRQRAAEIGYPSEQQDEEAAVRIIGRLDRDNQKRNLLQRAVQRITAEVKNLFGATLNPNEAATLIVAKAIKIGRTGRFDRVSTVLAPVTVPSWTASRPEATYAKEIGDDLDSTAEKGNWVETILMGNPVQVRGKIGTFSDQTTAASIAHAKIVFDAVGIPVTQEVRPDPRQGNKPITFWRLQNFGTDNVGGQKLVEEVKKQIDNFNPRTMPPDLLASLLNSIRINFAEGTMDQFAAPIRQNLFNLSQGYYSYVASILGAAASHSTQLLNAMKNVDVFINRAAWDSFGGDAINSFMQRVLEGFKNFFTPDEIENALKDKPQFKELLDRLMAQNYRDEGGRVYRKVQQQWKPKFAPKLSQLIQDNRVNEAAQAIIEEAKTRFGIEPKPSVRKNLTPYEKLLELVNEKTAAKVSKLMENAVADAEYNAGRRAMQDAAKTEADPAKKQEVADHLALMQADDTVQPLPEYVEKGLLLPEYANWKTVRDNWFDYSPVTMRLVRQVIQGDFKGTRFAKENPQAKAVDTKIDLNTLAKQPDEEVRRVLDAYYQNYEQAMGASGATDATNLRVGQMIEQQVSAQLEAARERFRSRMFAEKRPAGIKPTAEQLLAEELNAGLFKDVRLDIPDMVARAARKSRITNLLPTATRLAEQVLSTPAFRQSDIQQNFVSHLIDRLGIPEDQAQNAWKVFSQAFETRMAIARQKALLAARQSLTDREIKVLKPSNVFWKKVERAVNAGIMDSSEVLSEVAKENGWQMPTPGQVKNIKSLVEKEQQLRTLPKQRESQIRLASPNASPEELSALLERARREQEAATYEHRADLIRKLAVEWARMTRPINLTPWKYFSSKYRRNNAQALNEYETLDMLLKIGFGVFRLPTHIATQLVLHSVARPVARALTLRENDIVRGVTRGRVDRKFWSDVHTALSDSRTATLASLKSAAVSARAELLGRGESRNVDRLMSGINALERLAARARQENEKGRPWNAVLLHLLNAPRVVQWYVSAVDHFQGRPAEYQEILHQIEIKMREDGRSRAQINMAKEEVYKAMTSEFVRATADTQAMFDNLGIEASSQRIEEGANELVRRRIYDRLQQLGLPADAFEQDNNLLKSTIAWQEQVAHGLGGVLATGLRGVASAFEYAGLPTSVTRLSNAIGTGLNYALMNTPFYKAAGFKIPGVSRGQESPWFSTDLDRNHRMVQSIVGTTLGALASTLALAGLATIQFSGPKEKRERDLWTAQGHRPGTVEFNLPDGSFVPISLSVGPMSLLAPYFSTFGAIHNLAAARTQAQDKLNAEAAAKGLPAGKIAPITSLDVMAVAGNALLGSLLGSRTASGVVGSATEQGLPNAQKLAASFVSPLIPALPALQEISRMLGVQMDPKTASVWDYLVPLPTSPHRSVNALGDPVETPDDLQRVVQVITAGSYPLPVNPKELQSQAGYNALFETGYTPPSINPAKGYDINGVYRPMTDAELQAYTVNRGEMFKTALAELGANPTKQQVQQAYQQANRSALEAAGVTLPEKGARTSARAAAPAPAAHRGGATARSVRRHVLLPRLHHAGRRISGALHGRRTSVLRSHHRHSALLA